MKINNEFTVHTPIEQAWAVLTDLEGIAPCLPGAQITGVDGDVYRGKVKVKVGPVVSEFTGTAQFIEKDDASHRAVIDAKGRDARSAGNAAALITAELRPDGDATVVTVDTDLKISGRLAQFGSGMIKEVSGKLLGQFVASLEAKIGASDGDPPPAPAAPAASTSAEPVPAAAPEPANTSAAVAGRGGETTAFATDVEPGFTATPEVGGPAAAVRAGTRVPEKEPEPLDLMDLAGGSIGKRLMPLAIGLTVVAAAVVVYRIARR